MHAVLGLIFLKYISDAFQERHEQLLKEKDQGADLVDAMVALPGQLFYSTQIPACLWFLARDRKNGRFRDRRGRMLFIDARKMGVLIDRVHRELTPEDIAGIAESYHAWRGDSGAGKYEDVPGFCKSATVEEIQKNGYVLTPGR